MTGLLISLKSLMKRYFPKCSCHFSKSKECSCIFLVSLLLMSWKICECLFGLIHFVRDFVGGLVVLLSLNSLCL